MSRKPLQRFESIAQRLVEGSLGRLLGGRLDPLEISTEIARTIDHTQRSGVAPNHFQIQLHPSDYTYLRTKWPDVAEVLQQYVLQITRESSLALKSEPIIELMASPDIQRHFAHVHATHVTGPDETTSMFRPLANYDPLVAMRRLDAFLILDGKKHVPLDKPQMTLGRRTDCDIVIESGLVSRRHAQLRWRFGRFILFDLGSRAGTLVNGEAVNEFALRPGDVIQLADMSLIYGVGLEQTQAQRPIQTNQETLARPPIRRD